MAGDERLKLVDSVRDVVRCKRFELVDDTGKVRMVASTDEVCTRLDLLGPRGEEKLGLATFANSGSAEILMVCGNGDCFVGLWTPIFDKRPPIVPEAMQEFVDEATIVLQANGKDALTLRQFVKSAALEILQQKRAELTD